MRLGRGGFVLLETLACIMLALLAAVSAATAFGSAVKLLLGHDAGVQALNAAAGAEAAGYTPERETFYAEGLQQAFCVITVRDEAGEIAATLVTLDE